MWEIRQGDALERLREMPDESVQCCVSSPPYYGLRDYGLEPTDWPEVVYALPGGEITIPPMTCCLGLEETPEQFIGHLVLVYREIGRVLRADATAWVNLGDSYNSGAVARREPGRGTFGKHDWMGGSTVRAVAPDLKPKDLLMVPALAALALRADGWYLRRDIIWFKPNPMPESVQDRPTSAHEYLFLLTKSARYFYDSEAVREPATYAGPHSPAKSPHGQGFRDRSPEQEKARQDKQRGHARRHDGFNDRWDSMSKEEQQALGRNKRSVWTIATRPYRDAHFATFPVDLVEPCILAGSPEQACGECGAPWRRLVDVEYVKSPKHGEGSVVGRKEASGQNNFDGAGMPRLNKVTTTTGFEPTCECAAEPAAATVLDPFAGAATTGLVAARHNRDCIGIELNEDYVELGRRRILDDAPLINTPAEVEPVSISGGPNQMTVQEVIRDIEGSVS